MTPVIARAGRAALILSTAIAVLSLASREARSDEWTTYAYPNDQNDMVVVGNQIFIATSGGALRYDSTTGIFTQYTRRSSGGPSSQNLTTVCFDQPDGLLFFGSGDRGVTTYDLGSDRWGRFDFIPDNRIRNISRIGDEIYVGTISGFSVRRSAIRTDICNEIDRGLCCGADPDTCVFPSFDVRDFEELGPSVWAATAAGPAENDGTGWRARTAGASVLDARSLAVQDGVLFLATPDANGVFRWNPAAGAWSPAAAGLPGRALGNDVRLVSLPAGTGSRLWLATGFGAFTWTGDAWVGAGLADISVRSLAAVPRPAADPLVYAATKAGLYRHESGTDWTPLPAPGPPIDIDGQAIDVDKNGVLWIGTLGGAMSRTPAGAWTAYRNGQGGIDGSDIFSLFTDSRARVWLGKCCCRNPPSCPLQFLDGGTPSANLEAWDGWGLAEDGAGRLWVGSNGEGIRVLNPDGSVLSTITTADNLRSSSVRTIAASGNRILIGHEDRGLQILNTGGDPANPAGFAWRTFGTAELPDQTVADIALEGATGWVLTSSALHRLQGETLTDQRLDVDGEPRRGNAVDVDRKGTKWVGTNNGVLRIDRSGAVTVLNTSNSDLISDEVLDVAVDPVSGDVFFETRIGTSRLKPGTVAPPTTSGLYLYPNPFRPADGGTVKVGGGTADNARVMDLLGRSVAAFDPAGGWDGTDPDGHPVAPGIYLVNVGDQTLRLAVVE